MPFQFKQHHFILVVEDEALVRGCTVAQLEDAGSTVLEAANGEEALREFQAHDLLTTVFTDVNMPGAFDGLHLAHTMRRLRPGVQLILTSGRALVRPSDMPAGGRFLPKPYSCDDLTAMIEAA